MAKNLLIYGIICCLLASGAPFSANAQTPAPRMEQKAAEKQAWLAAALSLLMPGSGQMYVEERIWPEALITAGLLLGCAVFWGVDQQRAGSVRERVVRGESLRLADAHWDALTLALQIAIPALWLWNSGDAWRRAESLQKVTNPLDPAENAYIMKGRLVSVTLWQF